MAAELLVREPLTREMVEVGEALTRAIDTPFQLAAAFWYVIPESFTWRLYLGSPLVGTRGALWAYSFVQDVLLHGQIVQPEYGLYTLTLSDISVIDVQHTLVKVMRAALLDEVAQPQQDSQGHFRGLRVGRRAALGHYIEDAYIYKA